MVRFNKLVTALVLSVVCMMATEKVSKPVEADKTVAVKEVKSIPATMISAYSPVVNKYVAPKPKDKIDYCGAANQSCDALFPCCPGLSCNGGPSGNKCW